MSFDEMELDTLGDRKTALFIIISDTDTTFNFVAALMYSQLFNLLCDKADNEYGGRLPIQIFCSVLIKSRMSKSPQNSLFCGLLGLFAF
ncbi:hypothetical protein FACS1894217_05480 [Clostridia bacterium]|nr:hypothetical protein FACS1894217_05480 [Clostridia bacterium]